MGRASTRENKNIYQTTREAMHLTREAAGELLESIPPERIEKIENERSLPHPDEVLTMAEKYKQPGLCNYFSPPLIPALITLNVTVYNSLFYQLYCPSSHESRILKIGLIFL